DEIDIIQTLFVHKKFRKHQYILQQGEICRYESFIVKGLARKYQVDDKGQEHILQFLPEDWWAGDLYSFLCVAPSPYNVDCIEDTEVLRINKADLDVLYEKVPKMNIYFRVLYQNSIIAYNKRLFSIISKKGVERYEDFLNRYPTIQQRVPDHQIAAFLGLTPQSLSRIRNQSVRLTKANPSKL
ncbi:MAG TPA: Crp/Fnr family transcriptional regulator, partial [Flavisolibacter sp.]|nr:Crp/Fnr family transcriptional regulator [Flavisolibacter sp.]